MIGVWGVQRRPSTQLCFEVKVVVLESLNVSNIAKNGFTGKSWSEALIFASTNPQYDHRLFI
jgi:hypothetical protein